jgi:membrane fusion protein (multidrug efflux system)
MMSRHKTAFFLATLLALLPAPFARALEVQAVSSPSADITLSFVVSGRISRILVQEGDRVEAGQLLATLDDAPERIQTEQLKVQAADKTRILSAEAELEQKQVDLEKLEAARAKGAASSWEVEHMKLSVRMAELALRAATLEREQYSRQHAQAVRQLERMRLLSPISGRVEKVSVEAGEAVEKLGPVVRIVKTDPLWLDVPVPLTQARQLRIGQAAVVRFPGNPAGDASDGRIVHISAVADAASDTLRLRVEVANPSHRPAGERVTVNFPQIENGKASSAAKK